MNYSKQRAGPAARLNFAAATGSLPVAAATGSLPTPNPGPSRPARSGSHSSHESDGWPSLVSDPARLRHGYSSSSSSSASWLGPDTPAGVAPARRPDTALRVGPLSPSRRVCPPGHSMTAASNRRRSGPAWRPPAGVSSPPSRHVSSPGEHCPVSPSRHVAAAIRVVSVPSESFPSRPSHGAVARRSRRRSRSRVAS